MICVNASTDSNDSAISYSPLSLSSSPVKSLAIKQLLESPIIKTNSGSETLSQNSADSDTDPDGEDGLDEVMVAESPEPSPLPCPDPTDDQIVSDSQEAVICEVAATQQMPTDSEDKDNECSAAPQSPQTARNCLKRQTSVCVSNINANMTSSPRALAILKNAIKTSYSNRSSDKLNNNNNNNNNNNHFCEDINRNAMESANGVQSSPPKSSLIRNSPFSRGSAILRAAKERLERQEIERSPKFSYNYESNKLTSILRKHELQSSPTSCGEPKAKKKKVLFAEPVVSSELTFRPSPTLLDVQPIGQTVNKCFDRYLDELNDKKRNNLVHQNSEFDKEFDNNSIDSNDSDSPLLVTQQYFTEEELNEQMCGQHHNPVMPLIEESSQQSDSPDTDLLPFKSRNGLCSGSESESSEEPFMCAQRFPESNDTFSDLVPNSVSIQTDSNEYPYEDPIVNVPMRLSLIKELYNLFGDLIQQYSDS